MPSEADKRLARGLAKNSLLARLFDEQREELRLAWEAEQDSEKREQLWHRIQATNDLKDYTYGRLTELAESGD